VWRHSSIGAYRVQKKDLDTPAKAHNFKNALRSGIVWQAEGREASLAVTANGGFLVNGKSDGSSGEDAPTHVIGPRVGALLHGRVKRALVIGLGTGSSAGWLAAIPALERVDVIEIEPAIREVVRRFGPANRVPLSNPKVRLIIGDAREVLLTSRAKYD